MAELHDCKNIEKTKIELLKKLHENNQKIINDAVQKI